MSPDELRATLRLIDLPQTEVASLLGKSDRAIRLWLTGKWPVPTLQARVLRLLRWQILSPDHLKTADSAIDDTIEAGNP